MAKDINNVTIVGRLTKDAELKYTNSGFAISKISLAVNSTKKDGDQWVEEANFFDVTILGRVAETLNQYLQKGKQIAVSGELKQDRWEKEGQKRSKVYVLANNIQLLGGNSSDGQQQQYNQYNQGGNNSQNYNSSNANQNKVGDYRNTNRQRNNQNNFSNNGQRNNDYNPNKDSRHNSGSRNKPSYENYPSGNQGGNGNFDDSIPF